MPHALGSTCSANAMDMQDPHDCGRGKEKLCDSTPFHDGTTARLERFIGTKMTMRPYYLPVVLCPADPFEVAHINRSSTCLFRWFITSKFVVFDRKSSPSWHKSALHQHLACLRDRSLGRKSFSFGLDSSRFDCDQ